MDRLLLISALLAAAGGQAANTTSLTSLVTARENQLRATVADAEFAWSQRCSGAVQNCSSCVQDACKSLPASAGPACLNDALYGTAEFCPLYSGRVASLSTSVSFAVNASDPLSKTEMCALRLDSSYVNAATTFPSSRIQVFGTRSGVIQSYPGRVLTGATASSCSASSLDPRIAPWFVSAASGPKNVVIVMDVSGSMSQENKTTLSVSAARTVLQGLTPADSVTFMTFNSMATNCSRTLLQASAANLALLNSCLDAVVPGGGTSYVAAFTNAFALLRTAPTLTAGCNRNALIFLTDGEPTDAGYQFSDYVELAVTLNEGVGAHIFTYAIGTQSNVTILRAISCANTGTMQLVSNPTSIVSAMSQYYQFLAAGLTESTVRWLEPFYDTEGAGYVTSASLAAYDYSTAPATLLGVAAIDFPMTDFTLGSGCDASDSFGLMLNRSLQGCEAFNLTDCDMEYLRSLLGPASVCGPVLFPACSSNTSGGVVAGDGEVSGTCTVPDAVTPLCSEGAALSSVALVTNATCCPGASALQCPGGFALGFVTASPSSSSSVVMSVTPSASPSATLAGASSSGNHTTSTTRTTSRTSTHSPSQTPSFTPPASQTCLPLVPVSTPASCLLLPSPTESGSLTASASTTTTLSSSTGSTHSPTPTSSVSDSPPPTPSRAPSASSPPTPTGSPSATLTRSGAPTASSTPSGTPSAEPTPSATPTSTQSPSGSPSGTQSPSSTSYFGWCRAVTNGEAAWTGVSLEMAASPAAVNGTRSTASLGDARGGSAWWLDPLPIAPSFSLNASFSVRSGGGPLVVTGGLGNVTAMVQGSLLPNASALHDDGLSIVVQRGPAGALEIGVPGIPGGLPPVSPSVGFRITTLVNGSNGSNATSRVWLLTGWRISVLVDGVVDSGGGGSGLPRGVNATLVALASGAGSFAAGRLFNPTLNTTSSVEWSLGSELQPQSQQPRVLSLSSPVFAVATLSFNGTQEPSSTAPLLLRLNLTDVGSGASAVFVASISGLGGSLPSALGYSPQDLVGYEQVGLGPVGYMGFLGGPHVNSSVTATRYSLSSFYYTSASVPGYVAGCPLFPGTLSPTPRNATILLAALFAPAAAAAGVLDAGASAGIALGVVALLLLLFLLLLLLQRRTAQRLAKHMTAVRATALSTGSPSPFQHTISPAQRANMRTIVGARPQASTPTRGPATPRSISKRLSARILGALGVGATAPSAPSLEAGSSSNRSLHATSVENSVTGSARRLPPPPPPPPRGSSPQLSLRDRISQASLVRTPSGPLPALQIAAPPPGAVSFSQAASTQQRMSAARLLGISGKSLGDDMSPMSLPQETGAYRPTASAPSPLAPNLGSPQMAQSARLSSPAPALMPPLRVPVVILPSPPSTAAGGAPSPAVATSRSRSGWKTPRGPPTASTRSIVIQPAADIDFVYVGGTRIARAVNRPRSGTFKGVPTSGSSGGSPILSPVHRAAGVSSRDAWGFVAPGSGYAGPSALASAGVSSRGALAFTAKPLRRGATQTVQLEGDRSNVSAGMMYVAPSVAYSSAASSRGLSLQPMPANKRASIRARAAAAAGPTAPSSRALSNPPPSSGGRPSPGGDHLSPVGSGVGANLASGGGLQGRELAAAAGDLNSVVNPMMMPGGSGGSPRPLSARGGPGGSGSPSNGRPLSARGGGGSSARSAFARTVTRQ